ncbi:MAG: hypothetical protein EZS28_054588 [Streblomastix strix]|uniref:Uncharacterized protein n=1 Tax=Streblomastix strix TaxID=222440 RepID=A0A5J4QJH8_9EUKA|nr:MAG: hypothetical protein EZS28_054588 [Streblomastix strix]
METAIIDAVRMQVIVIYVYQTVGCAFGCIFTNESEGDYGYGFQSGLVYYCIELDATKDLYCIYIQIGEALLGDIFVLNETFVFSESFLCVLEGDIDVDQLEDDYDYINKVGDQGKREK